MSLGAWAMLTIACVILYGGALYYTSIGYGFDLERLMNRFGLRFVTRMWKRGPEGRVVVICGTIVFLLAIETVLFAGSAGPGEPGGEPEGEWVLMSDTLTVSGFMTEGNEDVVFGSGNAQYLHTVNLTLTWTDEADPPGGPLGLTPVNEPDTFTISFSAPNVTTVSETGQNDVNTKQGELTLRVPAPAEPLYHDNYAVTLSLDTAGDVEGRLRTWAQDNGNDWRLVVEYTYYVWVVPVTETG